MEQKHEITEMDLAPDIDVIDGQSIIARKSYTEIVHRFAQSTYADALPQIKTFLEQYIKGDFGKPDMTPLSMDLRSAWIGQGGEPFQPGFFCQLVDRYCHRANKGKPVRFDLHCGVNEMQVDTPVRISDRYTGPPASECPICTRCKRTIFEFDTQQDWTRHLRLLDSHQQKCTYYQRALCYCTFDKSDPLKPHHHRCPCAIEWAWKHYKKFAEPAPNQCQLKDIHKAIGDKGIPPASDVKPVKPAAAAKRKMEPEVEPKPATSPKKLKLSQDDLNLMKSALESELKRNVDAKTEAESKCIQLASGYQDVMKEWTSLAEKSLTHALAISKMRANIAELAAEHKIQFDKTEQLRMQHRAKEKDCAVLAEQHELVVRRIKELESQQSLLEKTRDVYSKSGIEAHDKAEQIRSRMQHILSELDSSLAESSRDM